MHTLGSSPSSRIPNEDQSGTVCSLVATVVVWSLLCALRMRVYRRRSNLYIPSWQTIVYASAFLPHLPLRFFFYYSLLFVLRISQLFFPVTSIQIPPNRVIDQHHVSTQFQPTFPIVSSVLILFDCRRNGKLVFSYRHILLCFLLLCCTDTAQNDPNRVRRVRIYQANNC